MFGSLESLNLKQQMKKIDQVICAALCLTHVIMLKLGWLVDQRIFSSYVINNNQLDLG